MVSVRVGKIYKQQIEDLSVEERLELLALVAKELAEKSAEAKPRKHSVLELHGLGKEIWQGIDAQNYVDRLRDEWDKPA